MTGTQVAVLGVAAMESSYENAVKSITLILRRRYKLTADEAKQAIAASPLKAIFEKDPEMAAHTSNEAWAREVYAYRAQNTAR